jgi:hypothetical protein
LYHSAHQTTIGRTATDVNTFSLAAKVVVIWSKVALNTPQGLRVGYLANATPDEVNMILPFDIHNPSIDSRIYNLVMMVELD